MKKKLLSLLVLLAAAVTGAWAQEITATGLYLEVSGTEATLMYDANFNADSGKPCHGVDGTAAGWYVAGPMPGFYQQYQDNRTLTTVTIDASCKNYTGTTLQRLFDWWDKLTTINNLENLNTSAVTNMSRMFAVCKALTSLDLSCLNTASVTNMHEMFNGLNLETIDLSGWDTSNVTDMGYMFYNCPNLKYIYVTGDLSTESVTKGNSMFESCPNLPGYDANKVTYEMAKLVPDGYLSPKPAASTTDYELTVEPSEHGSGTIKFFIDGKEVTGAMQADEGKTVTMTVTPDEGWMVDATSVKAESYTTWEAAGAPSRRSAPANITILGDITLNKSTTAENTWTFTMPAASVLVSAGYKKVSNLAFKPADKTNLITVEVDNVVKNRDPQDATKNVNIRRINNLLEGNAVKLTAKTGYKFRKVEVKKGVDYSFDLSTLTSNFEAMDGDILSGTTDKTVTIPNGAHVTLQGVNITSGAAIVCNGNATITLAPGSENIVTSTTEYNSGIRAGGNNTTLTINGTGKLTVKGAKRGAGIGSNRRGVCGNIVIEDGEIITTTGAYGAGIGSGYHATCGNITIKGGTITATGGNCAAGIGSSFDHAICGDILISGGTITANGGIKAAGIGTGSAQQGWPATCGNITITDGVTKVTATKGSSLALHSIGKGQNEDDLAACGTVTIGGTEGYISTSPYTYDPHQQ